MQRVARMIFRQYFLQCCSQLASPLAFIFNQSMEHGYLPWLSSTYLVASLHNANLQKVDTTDPNNYWPITLTCTLTLCEIMETIIKDQLLDILLGENLISKHQHGFMRKHSTSTNLLECTHDWIVGLSRGNNIDVVILVLVKPLIVLFFQVVS